MGEKISPPKTIKLIATGFYTGYLPLAPATWASFFTLIIWYILRNFPFIILILAIITFLMGLYSSNVVEKYWGKDPRSVVIDEISAMFFVLCFIRPEIKIAIIGFILFRLFDIVKPPPIGIFEKLSGGLGIMLDDLFAAVYARVLIFMISLWLIRNPVNIL